MGTGAPVTVDYTAAVMDMASIICDSPIGRAAPLDDAQTVARSLLAYLGINPATYAATQEAVVLAELRGELAALRSELAPIIVACTSLMALPKVAKQLMKNQQ